jgi:type IV pilus biogenesis protein CpaD/CtpE
MRVPWLVSAAFLSASCGPNHPPSARPVAPARAEPLSPIEDRSAQRCVTTSVAFQPPGAEHLAQVNAISLSVELARGCGAEVATLELFTPQGSAFDVRSAAFHGGQEVHFSFPVAGSAIEHRGLEGQWQVRTFVDGAASDPSGFELKR